MGSREVTPGESQDWSGRAAAVPDGAVAPLALRRDLATELFAHARECYPEECCGLLTGTPGGAPERVVRCTNVQSRRVAAGESDLDAGRAFWIDEAELYRALRDAEERGHALLGVYHSHVDTGSYLSHTDLAAAIGPDGEPLWPGVAQLVVSVHEGVVRDVAVYEWDGERRTFGGRRVVEGS